MISDLKRLRFFICYVQRFSLYSHLLYKTYAMGKIYSLCSKLISVCLILLGFNGCDQIGGGRVEYGTPHALYKVSGKVVSDADGKAIKGIRVTMIESDISSRVETTSTNTNGEFLLDDVSFFPLDEFKILIEDIDGEENGLFKDSEQTIKFVSSDYKGGKSWYKGKAEKNMGEIKLIPEEPSAE